MLSFFELFRVDAKKFFSMITVIFLIVMLFLSSYLVNQGIDDYHKINENEQSFIKIEKMMFARLMNYLHYSFFGVRIMFVPSPAVIFFSEPGTTGEMSAKIDSIMTMEIFNNLKGKSLFKDHFPGTLRFAGLMLLLGSLLAVFSGIGLRRSREYLKFLTGICPPRKLFPFLFISRVILVTGSFLVILGSQLLLLKAGGVQLSGTDVTGLLVYTAVSMVVLLVFVFSGIFMGGIFSTLKARTAGLIIWAVMVFIIPLMINTIIADDADKLQANHELNLKKLGVVNFFEKESEKKHGKFDKNNLELEREITEIFLNVYYPKILSFEKRMLEDIESLINKFRKMSLFFPAPFYTMTCKDVSSRGYDNYIGFHRYIIKMHRAFLRFWIDRVYYHDHKELVSFIKEDENLFHAQSSIPRYLLISLALHVFYILVLVAVSYNSYLRLLAKASDRGQFVNKKDLEIRLEKEKINVFYSHRPGLRDYLYAILSGRKHRNGPGFQLIFAGKPLTGKEKIKGFIYICDVDEFPWHLTWLDFVKLVLILNKTRLNERKHVINNLSKLKNQRFCKMDRGEKVEVLLQVLPYINGNIFLFYHTCKDLPLDYLIRFKNLVQTLVKQGATVIYISPDSSVNEVKKRVCREILPLKVWTEQVESLEFLEEKELTESCED
ncbi:MAG: hypothetical protein PVH61_29130 [Candidatus Aminicenantes bacterium]|jgi:hypothetical protein